MLTVAILVVVSIVAITIAWKVSQKPIKRIEPNGKAILVTGTFFLVSRFLGLKFYISAKDADNWM